MRQKIECLLLWVEDLKAGKLGDPKPNKIVNQLKSKYQK